MSSRGFTLRGLHVLLALLAFFGAVIAVNVVFALEAIRTFPGEDVQRSYLQGLHYNDTIAERRAQAMLGWRATATLGAAAHGASLSVTLSDRSGAPIDGVSISGELERPADARFDRQLVFSPEGGGRYAAQLEELPPGLWRLRAHAQDDGGGSLDFESEMIWRPSR